MADVSPSSPGTTPLVVAVVLIVTVGVTGFLPVLDCPQNSYVVHSGYGCYRCDDRGRITLFNRWRNGSPSKPVWDGQLISWIEGKGFNRTSFRLALDRADIFGGLPLTNAKRIAAAETLLALGEYEKVAVLVGTRNGGASVMITVVERPASPSR